MRALLIAAALFAAAPAFAQPAQSPTRLTLSEASRAPSGRLIVDGAQWRCEGTACTATGGTSQPASRACRRVVQRVGPVTAFSWKGVELSAAEIAACNA